MAASSLGWCGMGPGVFMAVLLVSRLEADTFSTFIILIPIFSFLGCCMCGVACTVCAFSCVDTTRLDEEGGPHTAGPSDVESGMEAELPTTMKNQDPGLVFVPSPPQEVEFVPSSSAGPSASASGGVDVTHIDADID
jgi:hypothetical protein